MPTHFTLSPPAFSSARAFTAPLANSAAAAVATTIPLLTRFIRTSPSFPRTPGVASQRTGFRRPIWLDVSAAPFGYTIGPPWGRGGAGCPPPPPRRPDPGGGGPPAPPPRPPPSPARPRPPPRPPRPPG